MNTEATLTYSKTGMSLNTDKTTFNVGSITDLYAHCLDWNDMNYYHATYPTYTTAVYRESKTDTAFNVVEKLMEKGHIKELSVKEFMALVKEIVATLL